MTTLSITRRGDGTPIAPQATFETTMHNEIEAVVNGNLDQNNFISPGVLVHDSPILSSVPTRKGKVVQLVTQSPGSPATGHGIRLIYDDVLSKWVSDPILQFHQHESVQANLGSGYSDPSWHVSLNQCWIPSFKRLYDSGLRPQGWMSAKISTTGGAGTGKTRMRIVDHTSSGFVTTVGTTADLTRSGSAVYVVQDWANFTITSAPVNDGAICVVDFGVTGDAGVTSQLVEFTGYVRMVSP